MAEEERSDQEKVSLGIATELVEFANSKVDAGVHPMVVASALRHAAANFTAFAYHGTDGPLDTERIMEEFLRLLEFYDNRHRGEARPMTALERLVEQVKND
jgi:hypothetical protein